MVLDRGIITSCDLPVDPHYQIKARKIWVLAPGEWAIASAVLYIGRVPVLYLPFFFRPGDEFFFHPAIGSRDREGNFLQTTTYLIGQKTRTPSALSVLAATEEQGQQYRREIRGLFLRQPEGEQVPVTENRFLKVFLDYYSRLGGFAGVSGDFPPKVSFRSGLGLSRNIYLTSKGYFALELDAFAPSYESVWNKAWLFGLQIPFRYGLDGKWNLSGARSKLSGKFEYYSDPFFARDFYNRSEEMALTRLLGMEATQTLIHDRRGEARPELGAQYAGRVPDRGSRPLPEQAVGALPERQPLLAEQAAQSDTEDKDLADPTAYFYYPVSLKLPERRAAGIRRPVVPAGHGDQRGPCRLRARRLAPRPGTCACRGRLSSPSNPPGPSEPPKRRPGLNARRKADGRGYRRR